MEFPAESYVKTRFLAVGAVRTPIGIVSNDQAGLRVKRTKINQSGRIPSNHLRVN